VRRSRRKVVKRQKSTKKLQVLECAANKKLKVMSHFACSVCYAEITSEKQVLKGVLKRHALNFLGSCPIDMNKAKATATAKSTRTAAKRGNRKSTRKAKDAAELRKQIETLVKREALNLVKTAIEEADKGHFAAMKYLFEMIGLYPGPGDSNSNNEEEPQGTESLAKTLLRRLGCPESMDGETDTDPATVSDTTGKNPEVHAAGNEP
jgi:hypothetical protein